MASGPRPVRLEYSDARTFEFRGAAEGSERLDVFLSKRLPDFSRTLLARLIREGRASKNGNRAKASTPVRRGDRISILLPRLITPELVPCDVPLEIIYEDADLLAVNKPPGMVVHPAGGHWTGTLVNALAARLGLSPDSDAYRPRIVHRLDKDTSGVVLVARTPRAASSLARQFALGRVEKEYRAVVTGRIERQTFTIEKPLGRLGGVRMGVTKAGKPSRTEVQVLERFRDHTYLAAAPKTGRTHQIRVHLAAIGHPCEGDLLYGRPGLICRQALHAARIEFQHPTRGDPATISAPLPADMEGLLDLLRRPP